MTETYGTNYEFAPDGTGTTIGPDVIGAVGLAFDKAGHVFIAGLTNIYELMPDGIESNYTSSSGVFGPCGLAYNSTGDLFVSDALGGHIYEYAPDGTRTTFAAGLTDARGLAFNRAGDLFVADGNSGNIYEFTTNGVRTTFASGLDGFPEALAFDSAGNLFVGNGPGNGPPDWGSIYEFTTNGVQTTFASDLDAVALAFNSAGDLFAADLNTNIFEFMPDGSHRIFATGFEDVGGLAFQPVPDLVAVVTNGVFQVNVSIPSPYPSTIIQSSTDLVNWLNIYTNRPPFVLTTALGTASPRLFYRAVLGP